ncbi:MAG TPA: prefoldin domain-containing protein [Vicinamibacterales bacterium]|nr:prefoldin domain-containing protein [Vicinamibacterales bacterium]
MPHQDYRRALEAAAREYESLGEQRRAIDQRIAELAQSIATLSKLLGLTPTVPMGLTDAVRLVVRGAGVPMTPVEVRDRLAAIGFDVSKYVNDLAAVHTILKRLNQAGELRFVPRAPGRHQYTWNHSVTPVALTRDIVQALHDNTIEREAAAARTEPEEPAPSRRGRRRTSRPQAHSRRSR